MIHKPIYDRVLVLPVQAGSLSAGGLLIPDVAKNSSPFQYGDVIAVGTGRVNLEGKVVPLTVKVGQCVMYIRKAGAVIEHESDETSGPVPHVLIREPDIMTIVEGVPRVTTLTGLDGRLLTMVPTSRGLPDSAYANDEAQTIAEREGWTDGEIVVDEFAPGDGPAELSP